MRKPLPFTLPAPCRTCGGPIIYSGTGRRPSVCSHACRAESRRKYAASRRVDRASEDAAVAALVATMRAESPEARRERMASYAEERRARAIAREREAAAFWTASDAMATFEDFRASTTDTYEPPALVELTPQPDGSLRWDDSRATPRSGDPAARWLAENHPTELATFPVA